MVEVFKTNVSKKSQAETLASELIQHFPLYDVYFDLEDCDRILRVEAPEIQKEKIIAIVLNSGFNCEELQG